MQPKIQLLRVVLMLFRRKAARVGQARLKSVSKTGAISRAGQNQGSLMWVASRDLCMLMVCAAERGHSAQYHLFGMEIKCSRNAFQG
ncbi:hypothetical protein, partial [Roseibium sp. RKSG952]|uniref:hypothetical protein n=1 Tax=Roseibium sp. RKSG952 TaxID=2529384 RepID=UPI001AD937CA